MPHASSILERLASRSIIRRGLRIDVHRHTPNMLHLFSKRDGTKQCYTHYLEQKTLEEGEDPLNQDYIIKAGLSGACEFLSKWLPYPKAVTYDLVPFGHEDIFVVHRRNRLSVRKMRFFDCCQCPCYAAPCLLPQFLFFCFFFGVILHYIAYLIELVC